MKVSLTTTFGNVVIELHQDKAPITTENFAQYVRDGHYDGTIFHRVIPGFMVQGGGFSAGMKEKKTRDSIKNEADNGLSNNTGTVAMARTPDPHSASAQFFINVEDNYFLNFKAPTRDGWGYCVFGTVVQGMDAVMSMTDVPTGRSGMHQDVPKEEITLTRAEVIEE
ncbi:MAG: peptidylprolyl isomerase [Gammaproteobacteria bacterium]|nr:peptidylprolyl isomerase [Gammaproteobacteria bacterium]